MRTGGRGTGNETSPGTPSCSDVSGASAGAPTRNCDSGSRVRLVQIATAGPPARAARADDAVLPEITKVLRPVLDFSVLSGARFKLKSLQLVVLRLDVDVGNPIVAPQPGFRLDYQRNSADSYAAVVDPRSSARCRFIV